MVLTGLAARRTFELRVSSGDADGNVARSAVRRLRSSGPGIAIQTLEGFRTGTWTSGLVLDGAGFGSLTMAGRGLGVLHLRGARLRAEGRLAARGPAGQRPRRHQRHGADPHGRHARAPAPPGPRGPAHAADGDSLKSSGRYLQYRVQLTASATAVPDVTAVGFTHTGVRRHEGELR